MSGSLLRIVTFLLGLFAVVVLTPLLALATYNHPSPTDDYCFANTVIHYGFWQAQQYYYDGWTGRFFHNFIVHTNPIILGWYGAYKVYPMILLALVLAGCYAIANQLLSSFFDLGAKLALAFGIFIGFITTLVGIPEYLYWYTGLASYGLSSALFLFLLAVLMAHQQRGFGWKSGYTLTESLLVTAIIGSSEMTMVLVLSVLALIVFGEFIQRQRVSATMLILLAVAAVACYYLFKAPGNAIRMGGNPQGSDIPFTLISSLKFAATYIPKQLFTTPWMPLSILYLPLVWKLAGTRRRRSDLPPYLRLHPLWGLVYMLATLLALISLHFYGVGIAPIPRLINLINLAFWLCLLYNLTLVVIRVRYRFEPDALVPYLRPVLLVAIIWAVVAASMGTLLPVVYGDWLSGRAAQYDREMLERYAQLSKPGNTNSVITPLSHYPVSLFLEDIHDNPQHLWNRCWADYFHKKTIILNGHQPTP
ncbi:DUF6056 family protein [Spirosoma panaciterrae]|uniref:DUF6056 family protein n=1 Tax=Spirosoma panaciterrae TaxID=496058 RepID=UPI0003819495|nr:DUF6056 family protein [Spirosoma panaciterrae]